MAELLMLVAATNEKVKVRNQLHIHDDLVFSVLSKLPLKSLKRFGCARKSWALLFKNPLFMSMYHNNFISNNHSYYDDTSLLLQLHVYDRDFDELYLLFGERFENRVKLDWPNPFQEDYPAFLTLGSGSTNGNIFLFYWRDGMEIVLWNPSIQEFKVIPPGPLDSIQETGFVFHGFGYDHARDYYKVILHTTFYPESEFDAGWQYMPRRDLWEIYSLRSNSWTKLDVDFPCCYNYEVDRLYMDGVCHWWGESEPYSDEAYLVSFDLSNDVFFITPMPSNEDDGFKFELGWRHFMVLNGSIAFISKNAETDIFHIFILGELSVKESWTKLFIVRPLTCVDHPIGVGKKEDIFFRKYDDELIWFDLSTQMTVELGIKGERFSCKIGIYR